MRALPEKRQRNARASGGGGQAHGKAVKTDRHSLAPGLVAHAVPGPVLAAEHR